MEITNTFKRETICQMKSETGYCPKPLETAATFLSKKWTMSLIITIGNFGSLRFTELQARISATPKIVAERLRELEKEDIVHRKSYHEIPPRVVYSLTPMGKQLLKALHPLLSWAERRKKE